MTKNTTTHITDYIGRKELLICLILTMLIILSSFGVHVRVSTTELTDRWGTKYEIYTLYYGLPFESLAMLQPVTETEQYVVGYPRVRVIWTGFLADFTLYFLLTFTIIYSYKRLRD